jgi:predicted transcriptional regulator
MVTSIQITEELQKELKQRKMYDKESYEDIIWDLLEDNMVLSEETKKAIKEAEEDFKHGRFSTLEEIEKELL